MPLTPSLLRSVRSMIDDVIRREGGYVNHPADRGGATKYGITQATLSLWRGKSVTADDVKSLTKDEARRIFHKRYYFDPGIDKLPPSIQPFVFDAAVNHGPERAIKFVQGVCADAGFDPGPIDGKVGPRTMTAADRYARQFLDELIGRRKLFYHGIVARDPSQEVFLAGWLNRLDEFRA